MLPKTRHDPFERLLFKGRCSAKKPAPVGSLYTDPHCRFPSHFMGLKLPSWFVRDHPAVPGIPPQGSVRIAQSIGGRMKSCKVEQMRQLRKKPIAHPMRLAHFGDGSRRLVLDKDMVLYQHKVLIVPHLWFRQPRSLNL